MRPIARQLMWVAVAAVMFVAAGVVQPILDEQSRQYDLNPVEVSGSFPFKSLLTMAPGGLRAPVVHYLWLRADNLKDKGRHHEAMQLADMICKLQPNFASVWGFHAWNMAWNISVTTHTPEERWMWVHNGIKLLRDEGIPRNRKSLLLYKELAWIYFQKMGRYMDDMHSVYKQRWAAQMQWLLASPPYGTTAETIDAFRVIAEAPLDKDRRRQGKAAIQRGQLKIVLSDPAVAAYADLLAAQDIAIGEDLLEAYNHFTLDEAVQTTRIRLPELKTDRDKAVSAVINSTAHAEARAKLLAFTRAQLLWNVYKLDPDWMLQLMEKYGPMDWRSVVAHGIYWSTYGLHICEARDLGDISSLNTDRVVLDCLKMLTASGRMAYITNPNNPDEPYITWGADWRFIDTTQAEYILMGQEMAKARGDAYERNQLSVGHINYLSAAIEMLYVRYRREKAQELLDWIIETYNPRGPEWSMLLEDFVVFRLNMGGQPSQDRTYAQISSALQTAFLQRSAGSMEGYNKSIEYAVRVYKAFQKDVPERIRMPEFGIFVRDTLLNMLIQPRIIGLNLSLEVRAGLYAGLDDQIRLRVYDQMTPSLRRQCELNNVDFAKAFPAPRGLEDFRSRQFAPR